MESPRFADHGTTRKDRWERSTREEQPDESLFPSFGD
jgi:hypothetical protein